MGRFLINVLKISVLLILYIVVANLDVKQKADRIRQSWTCDILIFYNYFLFTITCLVLALRVTKNQILVLLESSAFGLSIIIFTYYSIEFFVRALQMYEDLPEREQRKETEDYFLYMVFLICLVLNTMCIICVLYVLCYIALMTWQLRGVLFASDANENQESNLRVARQASNMRRLEAIKSHRKPMVNGFFFRSQTTCVICITEFEETEEIVELDCHNDHMYHYDCIENWISRGNRECPICRKVITFLDEDDDPYFK